MNKALLILLTLVTTPVFGEYRVYQYYVRSKVQNINSPNAQIVTSTLNPISYAAYNGGKLSVEVNLLRSWVCMGNTSHQDICAISEGKELEGAAQ
jgi:hypothetical protein